MTKLADPRRVAVIRALVEGNSIRTTARLTDTAQATILKLLIDVGGICLAYQDRVLRHLNLRRVLANELWAYARANKRSTTGHQGDVWLTTAMDADSKLMIAWFVGNRNHANTSAFMVDVAERLAGPAQFQTGGLSWCRAAVKNVAVLSDTDNAPIIKPCSQSIDDAESQCPLSPVVCTGETESPFTGTPDESNVGTGDAERRSHQMRMPLGFCTRLMRSSSKRAENLASAVSLYFMFYNFCRPHQTATKAAAGTETTPAMAAGIADHLWSIEEMLGRVRSA